MIEIGAHFSKTKYHYDLVRLLDKLRLINVGVHVRSLSFDGVGGVYGNSYELGVKRQGKT